MWYNRFSLFYNWLDWCIYYLCCISDNWWAIYTYEGFIFAQGEILSGLWIRIVSSFPNILSNWFTVTFESTPVNVLVLWFVQGRVFVKEVGDESQVQLRVPSDNICGCDKLSAAQPLCLLQHAFCPLDVVLLLQWKRMCQGWAQLPSATWSCVMWEGSGSLSDTLGVDTC